MRDRLRSAIVMISCTERVSSTRATAAAASEAAYPRLTSAATVLPAQIYTWSSESLRAFTERTSAGIIVLLVVLLSMNAVAILLRNKYERKW